jgi:uncharacterized protein
MMASDRFPQPDVFRLPVAGKVLLYAPLQGLSALVEPALVEPLRQALTGTALPASSQVQALFQALNGEAQAAAPGFFVPQPRPAELGRPLFLGLIPTRSCNMNCRYCDFIAPKQSSPLMDLDTARDAVDAYLRRLDELGMTHAELHFFGGEPFFAARTVHFAVEYFRAQAAQRGMTSHLEVITNGLFNERMARWAAGAFDTIFLSLDGPAEIQNRHRPGLDGRTVAAIIEQNAHFFSDSGVDLVLRACVTAETVQRMPEIAAWFAETFLPAQVCFETMLPSGMSQTFGLQPPDPWDFVRYYDAAADLLAARRIETVLSTADLGAPHLTFCPVGNDAIIVTPDRAVHTCYLLEEDWRAAGLDLTYARLGDAGALEVDRSAVARIRDLNVNRYPLCADCFCRYHCSGGCHVNRRQALLSTAPAADGDATCIQTRAITAAALLKRMGRDDLNKQWRADGAGFRASILNHKDRLV